MSIPLLSICIPTFNRCEYLRTTLTALTKEDRFHGSNDVELVVSDNASTDETQQMVAEFVGLFPAKVRYTRNAENLHDRNFELALRQGTGELLKLHNDTAVPKHGALNRLCDLVERYREEKPVIYLGNGGGRLSDFEDFIDPRAFLRAVSYKKTWIGTFTIWREELTSFPDFSRAASLQFTQVDVLLRRLRVVPRIIAVNSPWFDIQRVIGKGGYDLFETFGFKYSQVLRQFPDLITSAELESEMHDVCRELLIPWVLRVENGQATFSFKTSGTVLKSLFGTFRGNLYIAELGLRRGLVRMRKSAKRMLRLMYSGSFSRTRL